MRAYIAFWAFILAIGALIGLHLRGGISNATYVAIIAILAIMLLVRSERVKKAEH